MNQYVCGRCAHRNSWSHYGSHVNCMFRCERCWTPHTMPACEPIGPAILPVGDPTRRVAIWMPGRYTPASMGMYEVSLDTLASAVLSEWTGAAWTWGSISIDTARVMRWRGHWDQAE